MTRALSGTQYRLHHGGYVAHIASVGASLRTLSWRGRPLVRSFEADEVRPVFSGTVLAPWPNRVVDAVYEWDGSTQQLDVSEPARGHALHGFVLWQDFACLAASEDSLSLRAVIEPRSGYPHRVQVDVDYSLSDDGLTTRLEATLLDGAAAPFGWGSHSYLCAPGGNVNEWTLSLPARTVQHTETERLLPAALAPVEGTELDFMSPRALGETFIDHAYTDLVRDDAGLAHVDVTDAHGVGARMSWGPESPWVQIHTADRPEPHLHRSGMAVEPMSCPPGAFNSGTDVLTLETGEPVGASWRISAIG